MALVVIILAVFSLKFGDSHFLHISNATLYNIIAYTERDRALLYKYYMSETKVVFYNLVTNQAALPMKIVVDDSEREKFEEDMKGRYIQYSYISPKHWKKYLETNGKDEPLDPSRNFFTYEAIQKWAKKGTETYPDNFENKPLTFQTFEKRDVMTLRIAQNNKRKTNVYVIGGENARDWMSVAVIVNYMNQLLNSLKSQKVLKNDNKLREKPKPRKTLLDLYDMYFVPVLNPDGYAFNMETTVTRYWAKNRRIFFKRMCYGAVDAIGVNIDRNWQIPSIQGIDLECKGVFLGPVPLSESETYCLFKRLNFNAPKIMAVIIVKGFGRMITIPYAKPQQETINHDLMMQLLSAVTTKLRKKFNETFLYGTTDGYLYNYTGNMADFIKYKLNIPLVFTVYLQRGDKFLPDVDDIDILTRQLKTILEDILMVAKDIYGPLFSRQTCHNFQITKTVKLCFITLYVFLFNLISFQ